MKLYKYKVIFIVLLEICKKCVKLVSGVVRLFIV